jgi:WD40 repeat protein
MRTDTVLVVWVTGLMGLGLVAPLELLSALAEPPPMKLDKPNQLTEVSVPHRPSCLTWSTDGLYLAAGAWGWQPVGEKATTSEILVVDVGRAAVKTTLKASASVSGLAFSPDGKWLVVGTSPESYSGDAPAELVVFDVPAFTRKHTAKPSRAKVGFIDFAWSADGKTLCAIEGSIPGDEKNQVRRWTVPEFTEQPAIRTPQTGKYRSLAVSSDGSTLVVADNPALLRLFRLKAGDERTSFKIARGSDRLGFSADGKSVGVIDAGVLSWYEAETGKPAKRNTAKLVMLPAGLSDHSRSGYAVSPDGKKQVRASEQHPTIVFQKESPTEHGGFIHIVDNASGKTVNWRVGEAKGTLDRPVLAVSADGTKLAGTASGPSGEVIVIWSMP